MVFPSAPSYLDPINWPQQNLQQGRGSENHQLALPPQSDAPAGVASSSIRPNSMAEQARLAKLPPPEVALKCPRCSSTNTKFCYFNNYSLSQPRHFCKTCRRYWTKGGVLRSVPVGGGCRRNKKGKGSISKSQASDQHGGGGSNGAAVSSACTNPPPLLPFQMPFMPSLTYGTSDSGLNYGGIHMAGGGSEMDFPMSSGQNSLTSIIASATEQWRLQQQPYLGGLELPSGLHPLEDERLGSAAYGAGAASLIRPSRLSFSSAEAANQASSVKNEENNHGLTSSRQFLCVQGNDQQFLGGFNAWTDLSRFASSSSGGSRLM